MKYLLFLILPFALTAQMKDPNTEVKEMGLTQENINTLCATAYSGGDRLNGILAEIFLPLAIEGYNPSEMNQKEIHSTFKDIWNKKYSKCYCDYEGLLGPLDAIAIHSLNTDWVYWLYDNQSYGRTDPGKILGNINKIRTLDHRIDQKGTILDYLIELLNSDDYSITSDGNDYPNK